MRKKRVRAGHRSSATKMIGQIEEALEVTETNLSMLRQKRTALEEKLELLRQLDEEIMDALTEEDDFTEEIEQADAYRGKIQLAIIDIDAAILSATTPSESYGAGKGISRRSTPVLCDNSSHANGAGGEPFTRESSPTSSGTGSSSIPLSPPSSPPGRRGPRVKLPKLVLKKFGGDPTDWTTFWDSFESAVHMNPDLTGMDKFNYLHSLLERTAAEAISGLKVTAANYEEAISILKKRFGNKQQIINKHMDALLSLEPATSPSLKSLRQFFDRVESHVRGLHALEVPSSSYGGLLSSVLMNKLPPDVRLIVSRTIPEADWNLDVILNVVDKEINARERAVSVISVSGQQKKSHARDGQPTAASLFTKGSMVSCVYCDQSHPPASCTAVSDIETRKQRLKKAGRCFICLKRFHLGRNCHSTSRCSKCNGRHHVSICQNTQKEVRPLDKPASTDGTPTASMYAGVRTSVLLQTARVCVSQPEQPDLSLHTRMIFD